VLAWIWLDVALAAQRPSAIEDVAFIEGKSRATAYFYHYELPKIGAWLQVAASRDRTCSEMAEDAF
jgi:butyryl-CoA dehydrogenase